MEIFYYLKGIALTKKRGPAYMVFVVDEVYLVNDRVSKRETYYVAYKYFELTRKLKNQYINTLDSSRFIECSTVGDIIKKIERIRALKKSIFDIVLSADRKIKTYRDMKYFLDDGDRMIHLYKKGIEHSFMREELEVEKLNKRDILNLVKEEVLYKDIKKCLKESNLTYFLRQIKIKDKLNFFKACLRDLEIEWQPKNHY